MSPKPGGKNSGGSKKQTSGAKSRLSTQKNATLDARVRRSNSGAGWRNAAQNYGIST